MPHQCGCGNYWYEREQQAGQILDNNVYQHTYSDRFLIHLSFWRSVWERSVNDVSNVVQENANKCLCVIGVIILGIFVCQIAIFSAAEHWQLQGDEISRFQALLYALARFWSRFWWLGVPVIISAIFLVVGAVTIFRRTLSKPIR
jgi:hypothetical protein